MHQVDEVLMNERIEILSVDLLDSRAGLVEEFRTTARKLGLELGWHYALDFAWIASHLGEPSGKRILDAGAGTGVLQWWLADKGAEIVSVDRTDRTDLSCRFRMAYDVRGLRPEDLSPTWRLVPLRLLDRSRSIGGKIGGAAKAAITTFIEPMSSKASGKVIFYHQDLSSMPDLPDGSFDAIVSVSALEHNRPDTLQGTVKELLRVLKPDGLLLATLAAAKDQDWYHEPSKGWCYSDESLRRIFALSGSAWSNYQDYDLLFAKLFDCAELRENLPSEVFESGDNGMPWGNWDPKYQPVGVRKMISNRGRVALKREAHEQP